MKIYKKGTKIVVTKNIFNVVGADTIKATGEIVKSNSKEAIIKLDSPLPDKEGISFQNFLLLTNDNDFLAIESDTPKASKDISFTFYVDWEEGEILFEKDMEVVKENIFDGCHQDSEFIYFLQEKTAYSVYDLLNLGEEEKAQIKKDYVEYLVKDNCPIEKFCYTWNEDEEEFEETFSYEDEEEFEETFSYE